MINRSVSRLETALAWTPEAFENESANDRISHGRNGISVATPRLGREIRIDTVIGLPPNLFYSTGIPVCILVLKRCKKPDDVLFINAAAHFEKGKRQNRLLDEHIEEIVSTYRARSEKPHYSRRVPNDVIAGHEFNLNISRYIGASAAEEEIDPAAVNAELVSLDLTIKAATEKHNAFLKDLGLPPLP